ncbi:MAG: hypothetical protein KatS3mg093_255 [Candidatus Parcubacteria bacterium]|nr:MAG: hypothetical protein KatS3mg093_255 [Candidatus Parcubacteria bacterium]
MNIFLLEQINWNNILKGFLIGALIILIIVLIFYAIFILPPKYQELKQNWEYQQFCEENKDRIKEIKEKYPELLKKYPIGCDFKN